MAEVVDIAAHRDFARRDDEGCSRENAAEEADRPCDTSDVGDGDDDAETPHGWVTGAAKCMNCRHEWVAAAPAGTVFLVCPACDCEQGRWQYPFDVPADTVRWKCGCDCAEFQLVVEDAGEDDSPTFRTIVEKHNYSLMCCGCGARQAF